MVDYFALGVTHALILLAVWRLLQRNDLDQDPEPKAAAESANSAVPRIVRIKPRPGK
jgi:hypothetical protein